MKIHPWRLLVLAIAQPAVQASSERPRDAVALGRYRVQTAGLQRLPLARLQPAGRQDPGRHLAHG